MNQVSLSFEQVCFRYPSPRIGRSGVTVFTDFTWAMPAGRTVLLGPNGAGKTTLLSLAGSALRAQSGEIRLDGLSSVRDRKALRASIALMPQITRTIPGFTAKEQVAYAAWLRGADHRIAGISATAALERVGLERHGDTIATDLSGGQQRRLGLAQAIVQPARVLLLDEPTAGLDPAQRNGFRELIASLPADVPVLVSTHQVDDLGELFDTVVVLSGGQVRYQGTPNEFLSLADDGSPRPAEAAYVALLGSEA